MAVAFLVSKIDDYSGLVPLGVFTDKQQAWRSAFLYDLTLRMQFVTSSECTLVDVRPVSLNAMRATPSSPADDCYSFEMYATRVCPTDGMDVRRAFAAYMEVQRHKAEESNRLAARGVRGAGRYDMKAAGPVLRRHNISEHILAIAGPDH